MAIIAKEPERSFTPCPEGLHHAVCVDVVDLGVLQNVAYQVALDEMGHGTPAAGCIVRLPKAHTDPEFDVVASPPRDELFPSFLAVLAVWRWGHEGERAYQARRAT